jgi:hypothetical protein
MADDIKSCTIKLLPQDQWVTAADRARSINAANAPSLHMMGLMAPATVISPEHLVLLTAKYWGQSGVRLTVFRT